jgi:uncharacterized protein
MMHPCTELRHVNCVIGHGVFATQFIPKGTLTWVRDDLDITFSADQIADLNPLYQRTLDKYTFTDGRGWLVLCWDHARYVNHSCDANCLSAGYDFEIAVRDIMPGDELTDDYGTLNLAESFTCACGTAQCRKEVSPGDIESLAELWDSRVQAAFSDIARVAQPLWPLLKEKTEVEMALKNPERLRTIRRNCTPAR